MLGAAGLTVIDATEIATTLIVAVALFPSHDAVIVTGPPTATPVTVPVADTLATPASLDIHEIARPESAPPFASNVAAVSWTEAPTTIVGAAPVMVTEATEAGGGGGGGGGGGATISLPPHDRRIIPPTTLNRKRQVRPHGKLRTDASAKEDCDYPSGMVVLTGCFKNTYCDVVGEISQWRSIPD